MTMTRRDFLSASAALRRRRCLAARLGRAVAARGRHCRDRRGRRRHCRGAADHGGEPQGDRGGGGEPDRRPLPHRQHDLRRAVRSRRALDAQSRHQSDDQARAQCRASRSRPRRRARKSASAAATPAPARPRNFSRRWCAPTAPSTTPRAAGRRLLRSVLPKDLGDWAGDGGIRARRQFRRQGSEGYLRRSTRRARRIATPRSAAARAWAR